MAIDNFCEGKEMVNKDYKVLKKAAAELNEIMHQAHVNASDRAISEFSYLCTIRVLLLIPFPVQIIFRIAASYIITC